MNSRFWDFLGALLLLAAALSSCRPASRGRVITSGQLSLMQPERLTDASLLEIIPSDSFTLCRVRDPWKEGAFLATYVLVDRNRPLPGALPLGEVVRVPLQRALVYSSVHCALMEMLGCEASLMGVCDKDYIHLDFVSRGLDEGRIIDCGHSAAPSLEKVVEHGCDAVLLSPYQSGEGYGQILELGIPVIRCADYMETSPLGRSEWIRFYGLLLGRRAAADGIFQDVRQRYLTLREAAQKTSGRPGVFCDMKTGAVWYQPGGASTIGRILKDAGARYILEEDPSSGSLPLGFEQVLEKADTADFWLLKYSAPQDMTYLTLRAELEGYTRFEAWTKRRIFGCNTQYVPFYELEPFRPDLLLENLVNIFHPEIGTGVSTEFYSPLE